MRGFEFRRPFRCRRRLPHVSPALLLSVAGTILLFSSISKRMTPLVETMAVSEAVNEITLAVSESVDESICALQMEYGDLIETVYSNSGEITSLVFRVSGGSALKKELLSRLLTRLEGLNSEVLSIPIGNLSGYLLFSAMGPEIRVSVHSIGDVLAEFENEFTSAGVNQTRHSVYINVTVTMHLLIPGEIIPVSVNERICIAETVIVGSVPNTYLNL